MMCGLLRANGHAVSEARVGRALGVVNVPYHTARQQVQYFLLLRVPLKVLRHCFIYAHICTYMEMFPVTFHLTDLLLCCWTFVLLSYVYISISVCFCSVLSQLSLTTGNDRNTVSTSVAGCTQFESDSIHCTVLRSQAAYGPKRKNWNVWCHTCFGCGWFFWKSGGMEEHAS